jgi:hypothetical protein
VPMHHHDHIDYTGYRFTEFRHTDLSTVRKRAEHLGDPKVKCERCYQVVLETETVPIFFGEVGNFCKSCHYEKLDTKHREYEYIQELEEVRVAARGSGSIPPVASDGTGGSASSGEIRSSPTKRTLHVLPIKKESESPDDSEATSTQSEESDTEEKRFWEWANRAGEEDHRLWREEQNKMSHGEFRAAEHFDLRKRVLRSTIYGLTPPVKAIYGLTPPPDRHTPPTEYRKKKKKSTKEKKQNKAHAGKWLVDSGASDHMRAAPKDHGDRVVQLPPEQYASFNTALGRVGVTQGIATKAIPGLDGTEVVCA